ncbi:MAG: HNH endonuclease signature motif containing protein, partial [Mycobacterium sp.]
LGRSKRLASTGQRIVLYAHDRGCTFPGCTAPAYHGEVHHATKDWADGGETNIDDETLACGPDNRRVKPGGWRTRKRKDGRTEWIPPPKLDTGQARVNNYHHPERYLVPDDCDNNDGGDDP